MGHQTVDEYIDSTECAYEWAENRYRYQMMRHPDCRDPDHPGCVKCEPDIFISENEEDE